MTRQFQLNCFSKIFLTSHLVFCECFIVGIDCLILLFIFYFMINLFKCNWFSCKLHFNKVNRFRWTQWLMTWHQYNVLVTAILCYSLYLQEFGSHQTTLLLEYTILKVSHRNQTITRFYHLLHLILYSWIYYIHWWIVVHLKIQMNHFLNINCDFNWLALRHINIGSSMFEKVLNNRITFDLEGCRRNIFN